MLRLVLVIILIAGSASARQSWTERLSAAKTIEPLRALVLDLDEHCSAGATPSADDASLFRTSAMRLASSVRASNGATEDVDRLLARAQELWAEVGADAEAASVAYSKAVKTLDEGKLLEAERILRDALESHPAGGITLFQIRHLRGELLRKQSRFEEALSSADAAEHGLGDASVRATIGRVYGERAWHALRAGLSGLRGQCLRDLGLYGEARVAYAREKEEADASEHPTTRIAHVLHVTDLGLLTEDFDHVRDLVERSRQLFDGTDYEPVLDLTDGAALSELAREERDPDERARLVALAQQALVRARDDESLDVENAMIADLALADLELRAGALDEAAKHLASARERLALEGVTLAKRRAKLLSHEARLALARGVAQDELAPVRESMLDAYDELLRERAGAPYRLGGVGFLNVADRRELASTLVRVLIAADESGAAAEQALDQLLRAEALGTLARELGAPAMTVARVRKTLLGPGRGVLFYLVAKERSHVFAFDREVVLHEELPSKDELVRELRELVGALGTRPSTLGSKDAVKRHLARLGAATPSLDVLLPKRVAARVAGWSGLTVLGLELVGSPPLELAPLRGGPLGHRLAIDRAPSLALAAHLAGSAAPAERTVDLVLAAELAIDPQRLPAGVGAVDVEPIEFGEGTAEPLTEPWDETRVLLGADANVSAIAGAASSARVLHLFFHGVQLGGRERSGALVLPGLDGVELLTCERVETELAGKVPPLVVLSACGSGRAPLRAGDDELAHLGSAFLRAGARAVVLSRAQIELDTTMRLTAAFHERLAKGDSPAEALRAARVRLAQESDALRDFYLTQLEVVGLGHQPVVRR